MLKNETGDTSDEAKNEIQVNRPEPITSNIDVVPYKRRMGPEYAVDALIEGYYVLVIDYYTSGLSVLNELKKYLQDKHRDQSFLGQREFRAEFRGLSNRLLVRVVNQHLEVRKAPHIGWLEKLYPEVKEFLLPFPQLQGLNSAWQWYEKGISIPVLKRRIFPWYGTYFPTRFEHLELFDNWLKQYKGEKKSAIDIGIGSGILSFQMLQHGFEKIYGTDSNPNAIVGMHEYVNKRNLSSKIDLKYGDLFVDCNQQSELIVFNPPWLPSTRDTQGIDQAMYYGEDLFANFFAEAKKHLKADGRIVLLFSNLAQLTKVTDKHPIETELAQGGRFEKDILIQKEVQAASNKTRRNQNWRTNEMVELWVLKNKKE